MKLRFERQTCTRCGGSGEYSYCQMHGTTCFGCSGTGKQTSRNGRARRREYEARLKISSEISAYFIRPGDVVKLPYGRKNWVRVLTVDLDMLNSYRFVSLGFADRAYNACGMVMRHPGTKRVHEIMQTVARKKGAEFVS